MAYLQCCLVVVLPRSVHTIQPCSMLHVFSENLHMFCICLIKINVLLKKDLCFGLVCVVAVTRE